MYGRLLSMPPSWSGQRCHFCGRIKNSGELGWIWFANIMAYDTCPNHKKELGILVTYGI